ncbi:MAG TPA: putative ABC transporter permease [Terriglobales bacterium]|nr:putative ABC transporter permease [Terriglobales bacterium]
MESLIRCFLYFCLYSFAGWVCECVYCGLPAKKFVNRGFLTGPFCPIYGCGAVLVIRLLEPASHSLPLLFVLGALLTSAVEYVTSWGMEKLFHMTWWDYSDYPFNLHGRVCLKNSVLFGLMSVLLVRVVHPPVSRVVSGLPQGSRSILAAALALYLAADLHITVMNTLRLSGKLSEIEAALDNLRDRLAANVAEDIAQAREALVLLDLTRRFTHRRLLDAFPRMSDLRGDAIRYLRDRLDERRHSSHR